MANNLMNRFGTRQMPQAPIAPMQPQKPGMLEQIGTSVAMDAGKDIAKDVTQPYVDQLKTGASDALTSAQGAFGNALGLGAEAGSGMEAAMFEAAPFEAIGAEGIAATSELGAALAPEALGGAGLASGAGTAAATGAAGAGAGGMAALGAAMPWVGAGLLAGKAFGLFSKGGPVYKADGGYTYDQYKKDKEQEDYNKGSYGAFYAACGGKMPKYRAAGGPLGLMAINKYHDKLQNDPLALSPAAALFRAKGSDEPESGGFWNYIKKSFTEKPEWEDHVAVQVPVLDGEGNPTNMTSTVYRPAATPMRDPYAEEGAYDYEDEGDASYMAAAKPHSYVTQEAAPRRGVLRMTPLMPTYEEASNVQRESYADPYYFDTQEDFSQIKPYRREEPVREEIPSWMLPYYDPANRFKKEAYATPFNNGGMVGPLKSIKYKSSGGDVYSQEYDTKYRFWGSDEPEGARERETAAEQAREGAEAIGTQMPGALGSMSDYLARRRKYTEEMNKLLGK